MINVLIPLAGSSPYFEKRDQVLPKPLLEVKGLPMIQRALQSFTTLTEDHRFIFVLKKNHITKFHMDNILRLLTDNNCHIVTQESDAAGAACSCLLAIDHINTNSPLIISNGDQILDCNLQEAITQFRRESADAGVIHFDSVHPQWSYIKFDKNGDGVEIAEKNPISRNSIAGFYYFQRGSDFVSAAQSTILKESRVNNLFYVAPTLNELILKGLKIRGVQIHSNCLHSFYSPERVREFENKFPELGA